tara:strand:- start:245 stop:1321 length:1077 start_codon:yes stop_codon:yes gene_type:complete
MALQNLRSSTAHKRATASSLSDGQIALNTNATSPGVFFKDSGGALIKVGPVHIGTSAPNSSPAGSSGNAIGEQWLDTTGGGYLLKIWDGTAWRSETGEFVDADGDTMTGALILPSGTAAAPALGVGSADNGVYSSGTDEVAFSTNGAERVRIASNGAIGLGGANYGTSSQVLTSNGSGSAPTWQDAAGGGGAWNLLSTTTASSASTVDITSNINSTYRQYAILGSEVETSGNVLFCMQFYVNGTLNTSSEYNYANVQYRSSPSRASSSSSGRIELTDGISEGLGEGLNLVEIIIDDPSTSKTFYRAGYTLHTGQGASNGGILGSGSMEKGSAFTNVDGVRLFPVSGTVSGVFKLYGIS